MADDSKCVFVTVGSTSFDELIQVVSSEEICQILLRLGYKKLMLQIGRGNYIPDTSGIPGLAVDFFRYKDSIDEDIRSASLVLSHAGAGSVLESLGAQRPLLVVINENLMGNHQLELAQQLARDNHLYYCTCGELCSMLETMDLKKLKPYEPGQPHKFATFLDKLMGVS